MRSKPSTHLRGRPISALVSALSAQPACAHCAYPAHSSLCPECGADLTGANARIDLGSPQRDLRLAALPTLFIALAPVMATMLAAPRAGSSSIILNALALLLLTLALAPLATLHAPHPARTQSLLHWLRASFFLALPLLTAIPLLRLSALLHYEADLSPSLSLVPPLLLWIALITWAWFLWRRDWSRETLPTRARLPHAAAAAILTASSLSGFFWFPLAAIAMLTR